MIYILILLFIPIFFVGVVTYSSTLYEYIFTGSFDTVILLIGIFASIISSFILFKSILFIDKEEYSLIRLQERVDAIIGLISFTLLFLFGITLIANTFVKGMNYPKLLIGVSLVVAYLYVIYYYFIQKKEYECKVIDITKMNDKLYCVTVENKEIGLHEMYYKTKPDIKKNTVYKCYYNKGCKILTNIDKEVVEVK